MLSDSEGEETKRGRVLKKGKNGWVTLWHERTFVLRGAFLHSFRGEESRGTTVLSGSCQVLRTQHSTQPFSFVLQDTKRGDQIECAVESAWERDEWVRLLNDAIQASRSRVERPSEVLGELAHEMARPARPASLNGRFLSFLNSLLPSHGMSAAPPHLHTHYDLVVVGGGPIGLSVAYASAKRGKSVLVLERFALYNQSGSSGDLVRMFRTMYTEGFMADLAKDALGLWRELEAASGETLIHMSGLLNFGDPDYATGPEGNLMDPIENLKRLHMQYQELDANDIMQNYPFRDLPDHFKGLYAPDNGCINIPLVLRTLARLASNHGATIVQWADVKSLDPLPSGGFDVCAVIGNLTPLRFCAQKCAITSGAYTNHVLEPSFGFRLDLDIWEMAYEYYAMDTAVTFPANPRAPRGTVESLSGQPFKSMWFQFMENDDAQDMSTSNLFYGFPCVPWGPPNLCRIAVDNAVRRIKDPSERSPQPPPIDVSRTARFLKRHVPAAIAYPMFQGVCLQTNVCDNMFVLDFLPPSVRNHKDAVVFCAGWAFKFVPLIGKALDQLLWDGASKFDVSQFRVTRPGVIDRGASVGVGADPLQPLRVVSPGFHYPILGPRFSHHHARSRAADKSAHPRVGAASSSQHRFPQQAGQGREARSRVAAGARRRDSPATNGHASNGAAPQQHQQQPQPQPQPPPTSPSPASPPPPAVAPLSMRARFARKLLEKQRPVMAPLVPSSTPLPRVGIVGAGAAGLYAALLLEDLGFDCEVLEANPQRVGGRIFTRYFGNSKTAKPGTPEFYNYVDLGAMRFPSHHIHDRVVGKQPWSLVSKINANRPERLHIVLVEYVLQHPNNVVLYNGRRVLERDDVPGEDVFGFGKRSGGPVPNAFVENDHGRGYAFWLETAVGGLKARMHEDFDRGFEELLRHDDKSFRQFLSEFLRSNPGDPSTFVGRYPREVIDWLELRDSATGLYDMAFTEAVMDSFEFEEPAPSLPPPVPIPAPSPSQSGQLRNGAVAAVVGGEANGASHLNGAVREGEGEDESGEGEGEVEEEDKGEEAESGEGEQEASVHQNDAGLKWVAVDGGCSRLVEGMVALLSRRAQPQVGCKVTCMEPCRGGVQLTIQRAPAADLGCGSAAAGNSDAGSEGAARGGGVETKTFPHVISTLPFGVLAQVDTTRCRFTQGKASAVRAIHYDVAVKVAVTFRTRFWEDPDKMQGQPFVGGQSNTDGVVRRVVYPSYGAKVPGAPGVLIASYTWAQDAQRMAGLPHKDRVETCLKHLEAMHGSVVREQYLGIEHTDSVSWQDEEFALGAFALTQPSQFTTLFPHAVEPALDNRLHFAGEATSIHHAWVVGSLNSAYRCVVEILCREGRQDKLRELRERWGDVDEINLPIERSDG